MLFAYESLRISFFYHTQILISSVQPFDYLQVSRPSFDLAITPSTYILYIQYSVYKRVGQSTSSTKYLKYRVLKSNQVLF